MPGLKGNFRQDCNPQEHECFISVLSRISDLYPNSSGILTYETLVHPTTRVYGGKAELTSLGKISTVFNQGNKSETALTAYALVQGVILPEIFRKDSAVKIAGRLNITSMQVFEALTPNRVAYIDDGFDQLVFDPQMLSRYLLPIIETAANQYLGFGMELPKIQGMKVKDAELELKDGALRIGADLVHYDKAFRFKQKNVN